MSEYNVPATFDPKKLTFEGKKHTYKILQSLPVCRFKELPLIEYELAFGADVNALISWANSAFQNLNTKENWANVSVDLYKLKEAMNNIKSRQLPILKLMDIYTIREGDELEDYGGKILEEKTEDWANIDSGFFLEIAKSIIPNLYQN